MRVGVRVREVALAGESGRCEWGVVAGVYLESTRRPLWQTPVFEGGCDDVARRTAENWARARGYELVELYGPERREPVLVAVLAVGEGRVGLVVDEDGWELYRSRVYSDELFARTDAHQWCEIKGLKFSGGVA